MRRKKAKRKSHHGHYSDTNPNHLQQNAFERHEVLHHDLRPKIKDVEGNYDLDGVSQDKDFTVIVASENGLIPPRSFKELINRVKTHYKMLHSDN